MAAPLHNDKRSVDLATTESVRISRIRRDPVVAEKKLTVPDVEGRDTRTVIIGVVTFALAIVVASLGLMAAGEWQVQDTVLNVSTRPAGS